MSNKREGLDTLAPASAPGPRPAPIPAPAPAPVPAPAPEAIPGPAYIAITNVNATANNKLVSVGVANLTQQQLLSHVSTAMSNIQYKIDLINSMIPHSVTDIVVNSISQSNNIKPVITITNEPYALETNANPLSVTGYSSSPGIAPIKQGPMNGKWLLDIILPLGQQGAPGQDGAPGPKGPNGPEGDIGPQGMRGPWSTNK